MTKITESGGRQNIFANEPQLQIDQDYIGHPEEAEKANGRWAMIGFIALMGAYASTGQVIPGIF
tara:strand:- start:84 stop:275 length:192 start_codon:yes stop_codon:yes gene_type:complete